MAVYRPPIYLHTVLDSPGTVAPKVFLSIFNPSSSQFTLVFLFVEIAVYALGATGGTSSISAFRTTASSGGTEITAPTVNRFNTRHEDPTGQVRVENPTITIDPAFPHALNGWPPPQTTGIGGVINVTGAAPGEGFICTPGQGLALRTESGDTDQRWKVNVLWLEVAND